MWCTGIRRRSGLIDPLPALHSRILAIPITRTDFIRSLPNLTQQL
jgi:hypothetical protein